MNYNPQITQIEMNYNPQITQIKDGLHRCFYRSRHCERSEAIQKRRINTGLLRYARNDEQRISF